MIKCFASTSFASLAALGFTVLSANPLAAQELKPIFNGTNLEGWIQRGGKAKYEVTDGDRRQDGQGRAEQFFVHDPGLCRLCARTGNPRRQGTEFRRADSQPQF